MNQILLSMQGKLLPSYTGRVRYKVTSVEDGISVTLECRTRKKPSILPWGDIRRVFDLAVTNLTPTRVDIILHKPQNRDSSTMCALILAMRNPDRVQN
jgi:hypothetical protein